jgi:transcriptional regulator with PAS, ATPase and Fis domain
MEERLQIKNKQLKVLKERVRTFRSHLTHASKTNSQSMNSLTFDHGISQSIINAYYLGNDPIFKKLLKIQQPDSITFNNNSSDDADLVILDGGMINEDLCFLFEELNKPLLVITDQEEIRKLPGELFSSRLTQFLQPNEIETGLTAACRALCAVQQAVLFENNGHKLISASPCIVDLLSRIATAAVKANCILITGETGTGKELLASYILHHSRTNKMISVNCAAIPELLFESEFFGHDKGAFTGAVKKHRGLLEQARDGFLFLDEIGELPMNLQAKFLRILEGSSFERVGGTKPLQPHVRYITSTNQDLSKMVDQGRFRTDLFFRLNQVHFHLPPLNQRQEDIPLLAYYFLWKHNGKFGKNCRLSHSYIEALQEYSWTGHIRELTNMIQQDVLSAQDGNTLEWMTHHQDHTFPTHFVDQVREYERKLIVEALDRCGSQRAAADHLNLPLSTLHSKIRKYNLSPT